MHPLLTQPGNFLLYLAAWVPVGGMFCFALTTSGRLSWIQSAAVILPLIIILAFMCLTAWYPCRSMPLGTTLRGKLALYHTASAAVKSGLVLLAFAPVQYLLHLVWPDIYGRFHPFLQLAAIFAALMYLLSVGFHYAVLALESSRKAEVLAREAELRALKAQVNPHFLFNSLNSISALTTIDAHKAREMCIRLAEFLRISLRLGERATISFGEELELTRTYLDVEQVRFGDRLRVCEQIEKNCADCDVPPLLVQPLVENAIKHGIATLVEGGEVIMSGHRLRDGVEFSIENPFDPEAPLTRRSGIGLRNVRDRLHARYSDAAKLDIGVRDGRYRVTLFLPCDGVRAPLKELT